MNKKMSHKIKGILYQVFIPINKASFYSESILSVSKYLLTATRSQ